MDIATLTAAERTRQREEEAEAARAEQEAALAAARDAQAQAAAQNMAENQAQVAAGQQIAAIEAAYTSEYYAWKAQREAEMADYNKKLAAWEAERRAAEASVLMTALGQLAPGSQISDLPPAIQELFWTLGNMHYETPDDYVTNAAWTDGDGDTWNFQDAERRNLGYYQYLIRTAAAAGDMAAVVAHTQQASQYIDQALADRINRELKAVSANNVANTTRSMYEVGSDQISGLTSLVERGIVATHVILDIRADDLKNEMTDRDRDYLSSTVDKDLQIWKDKSGAVILSTFNNLTSALAQVPDATMPWPAEGRVARSAELDPSMLTDVQLQAINDQLEESGLADLEELTGSQQSDTVRIAQALVLNSFGVDLTSDSGYGSSNDWTSWSAVGVQNMYKSVMLTTDAMFGTSDGWASYVTPETASILFRRVFGPLKIEISSKTHYELRGEDG
jgi:hypothetical protein